MPSPDETLHQYFRERLGLYIPRRTICPNHDPPFQFFADAFYERQGQIIGLSSRTGGKSIGVAALNVAEMSLKPRCGIVSLAGNFNQAQRGYQYVREFFKRDKGLASKLSGPPLQKRTQLVNGSSLEILTASERSVHSPHVPKLRIDEVDLVDYMIYQGALSIPISYPHIKATVVMTSTRFKAYGLMYQLIEEAASREVIVKSWCFPAGTQIQMEGGLIPIEQIGVGERVLSEGQWRSVTDVMSRPFDGELVGLESRLARPLWLTPDHPVLVAWDDRLGQLAQKPRSPRKGGYELRWLPAGELSAGAYVVLDELNESLTEPMREWPVPESYRGHPNRRWLESYPLDEEGLWVIGMYLAEGFPTRQGICFGLDQDEGAEVARLMAFFENLGFQPRTRQDKRSRSVGVFLSSAVLREWFPEWLGKGCQHKAVPERLMRLPTYQLRHLLAGLMSGDGCHAGNVYTTTSPRLAEQVAELSRRLGGYPGILHREVPGKREVYVVGNAQPENDLSSYRSRRGYWELEGRELVRLREVHRAPAVCQVYDLTVDETHCLSAHHLSVHNCVREVMEPCPYRYEKCPMRKCEGFCDGRKCKQSEGYLKVDDIYAKFLQLDEETWRTQWLIEKPSRIGLIYDMFGDEHIIKDEDCPPFLRLDQFKDPYGDIRLDPAITPRWDCQFDYIGGVDWGWEDPAVILLAARLPNDDVYILDELYIQHHTVAQIGDKAARKFPMLVARPYDQNWDQYQVAPVYVDPSDPGGAHEFQMRNFLVVSRKYNPQEGISLVRRFLKPPAAERPKLFIHERCTELRREMNSYRLKEDKDVPERGDDHGPDALRYLMNGTFIPAGVVIEEGLTWSPSQVPISPDLNFHIPGALD